MELGNQIQIIGLIVLSLIFRRAFCNDNCGPSITKVKVGQTVSYKIDTSPQFPECTFDYTNDLRRALADFGSNVSDARLNLTLYVPESTDMCRPLIFTIRQSEQHKLVKLPYTYNQNADCRNSNTSKWFYMAGGTLCLDPRKGNNTGELFITVETETGNETVDFSFRLDIEPGLNLVLDEAKPTQILSPTVSTYYRFNFSDPRNKGVKNVSIITRAIGEGMPCSIISFQDPYCPVLDVQQTIDYEGRSQRTLGLSVKHMYRGQLIDQKDFYSEGFVVVIVVFDDDKRCRDSHHNHEMKDLPRYAQFLINVTRSPWDSSAQIDWPNWIHPFVAVFVGLSSAVLLTMLSWMFCLRTERRISGRRHRQRLEDGKSYHEIDLNPSVDMDDLTTNNLRKIKAVEGCLCKSCLTPVKKKEKEPVIILMLELFVSEFVLEKRKKESQHLHEETKNSNKHYSIAVITFVVFHTISLTTTTDLTDCFYNKLCTYEGSLMEQIPISFYTWNAITSSFSYSLCGAVYLCFIMFFRKDIYPSKPSRILVFDANGTGLMQEEFGIPMSTRLDRALGFLLTLEGFLCAMFHVCPNGASYQIDAPILELIAILSWIKVYQLRYPIYTTTSATTDIAIAFTFFGFTCTLGHLLHLEEQNWFKTVLVLFMLFYSSLISIHTFHMYWLGYIRIKTSQSENQTHTSGLAKSRVVFDVFEMLRILWRIRAHPVYRTSSTVSYRKFDKKIGIIILIANLISVWIPTILFCAGQLEPKEEFSEILIDMIQANVILAVIIHFCRKIYHENLDKTYFLPILFFIVHLILFYFEKFTFERTPYDWASTLPETRDLNEKCLDGGVYDVHDYFHFFKSSRLFFLFMTFTTMNDGTILLRRKYLKIF